jgi:hypothetical protein
MREKKENRREKKRIYVALLMLMMLSGSTSLVLGQPGGNRVEIVSGTAENVYGIDMYEGTAEGNTVTLSSMTRVGRVYGAHIKVGTAEGNTVILSSMRVPEVHGGCIWRSGAARGNRVILNSIENVVEAYGGHVGNEGSYGNGVDGDGIVEGNEIIATDTAVSIVRPHWSGIGPTRGDVCGGKVWVLGRGIAAGNKVTLRNVISENHGSVEGGWVANSGVAIGNKVEINGGRIILSCTGGVIRGGHVGEGRVEGNTVTLNDVIVGTDGQDVSVYGGTCGGGTVTGNTVTLRGGEIRGAGNVYGGCVSAIDGTATGNEINIEGNVRIGRTLYGGYIAGKYFSARERGHVRVTMTNGNGDTFTVAPPPQYIEETRHGFYVRMGDAVTGNTLNLRHCFLRVETIKNFKYINLYMNQDEFLGDNPFVIASQEIDLRVATIELSMNITDQGRLNDLVGREKVLMRSERGIKNFRPRDFTFSIEGDVNRGSPRPQAEVSVRGWGKMLVARIKRLVLPEPVYYTEPQVQPFERMNDLSQIRIDGCCCNVA